MIAIDNDMVTIDYPLTVKEYERYQKYSEIIRSVLIQYDLLRESKLHLGNLLFYSIQFDRKHTELIRRKAQYARIDNIIEFIRLTKNLSPAEKQKVQISFLIKNQPFDFKDQPILVEKALNKLLGITIENIRVGYPELWNQHFREKSRVVRERAQAVSVLRNIAVAEITKQIIVYLNEHSVKLKNGKAKTDKVTITSKQGNFIYDLLTELGVYKPTKAEKKDMGKKEASYNSLRKLLKRY